MSSPVTPAIREWAERGRPGAQVTGCTVRARSPEVARYTRTWERLTGEPLPATVLELGYRWAALQLPVQYLPWTAAHRSTREVDAALDRIERALGQLPP